MKRVLAEEIANAELAKLAREIDIPIELHSDLTMEKRLAWVFFYNSKEYIETGDYKVALLGAGPIVIFKADGRVESHGSVPPVERIIASLE